MTTTMKTKMKTMTTTMMIMMPMIMMIMILTKPVGSRFRPPFQGTSMTTKTTMETTTKMKPVGSRCSRPSFLFKQRLHSPAPFGIVNKVCPEIIIWNFQAGHRRHHEPWYLPIRARPIQPTSLLVVESNVLAFQRLQQLRNLRKTFNVQNLV